MVLLAGEPFCCVEIKSSGYGTLEISPSLDGGPSLYKAGPWEEGTIVFFNWVGLHEGGD